MATPLTPASFDTARAADTAEVRPRKESGGSTRLPNWAREPLLHFVLIGAALFAADQIRVMNSDDPHTIVVGPEVDAEAVKVFKDSRGREPNEKELRALHQIWIDNEVLYREGLAMGVDKGDDAIRDRVIFKALSVVDANVKRPEPDEAALRKYFESHRDKYDEPARYDFQEAALSGDSSESAVHAFVDTLNTGTPGDAQAGLRIFKGRPLSNLVQSYGEEFPKELEAAGVGTWHAVKTRDGWRAIHLDSITPTRPAAFEVFRGPVTSDWKNDSASEQRTAAVRAMASKYKVKIQSGAPAHSRGVAE